MKRSGKCMCGAVAYEAEIQAESSACHCGMCRRWAGGPNLVVPARAVEWTGEETITVFKSSDWAERGFCSRCGSNLFYRVTTGKHQGTTSIAFGTLDDQSGIELTKEWFIDRKPDTYHLDGERKCFTEEEVFAMFGG